MTRFHQLVVTVDDYSPDPEGKRYYSLPIEVWKDLNNMFMLRLKEMALESPWEFEVEDEYAILSAPITKGSHEEIWQFKVSAGIPKIIEESVSKNREDIPVHYRIVVRREDTAWDIIADYDESGKGTYDPCHWSTTIVGLIERYCLTEKMVEFKKVS